MNLLYQNKYFGLYASEDLMKLDAHLLDILAKEFTSIIRSDYMLTNVDLIDLVEILLGNLEIYTNENFIFLYKNIEIVNK